MKRLLKKSFWKTLFLSYLVILIFSLTIGSVLLGTLSRQIEASTERFSSIALGQVSDAFLQAQKDLGTVINTMRTRQEYVSLTYAEPDLTNEKRQKIADLQKELLRQSAFSNYVSGIYIWFDRPQIAATTEGLIKSADSFDGVLQRQFGKRLKELLAMAAEQKDGSLHLLGRDGTADGVLALAQNPPDSTGSSSVIILKLRPEAFLRLLAQEGGGENQTVFWAVSDSNRLILAPVGARELSAIVDCDSLADNTAQRLLYQGYDLAVMTAPSEVGFHIVSAIAFPSYIQALRHWQIMAAALVAVYLAVGVVAAYFLSRRNSQPVKRLNSIILDMAGSSEDGDFAVLEAGINSLLQHSREYDRAKVREENRLQQECLCSLLLGELEDAEAAQICARHGISFQGSRFLLVGAVVRDYSGLFRDGSTARGKEAQDLALFAASSVISELLGECGSSYVCPHQGRLLAAVSPAVGKGTDKGIWACCERAEVFLREQLGIRVSLYISRLSPPSKAAAALPSAYREVCWGLEQLEGYDMQAPVADRTLVESLLRPRGECPPADTELKRQQFCSAVSAGDLQEADRLYLELRREGLAFADESFSVVKMQSSVLASLLLRGLPAQLQRGEAQTVDSYADAIRDAQNDEELMASMHRWMEYCHRLYGTARQHNLPGERDVAREAAGYVNEHYADLSVSVTQVAEALGVSTSYLSRVYKKKYSMSVFDYIHRRRIDAAKLMLRESENTIDNIAGQAGYSTALALIRAFRREEGCTPTEYRRSLDKG